MLSCIVHAAPAKLFQQLLMILVSFQIQMIISITNKQDTLNSVKMDAKSSHSQDEKLLTKLIIPEVDQDDI